MIFLPIGLAAVAAILFFIGRSQGKKALDIASTETSTAASLATEASDVAAEIGAGSFAKAAEIKGEVECDSPLEAEMSGIPCVWYRSTVVREYEESYTERDSNGNTRSGTRRGSETVSANERRERFMVRDATGAVEVDPEGAPMDGERVLSRFEQGDRGPALSIGGFRLALGAVGGGRRTIGYKLEEWALPVGARVYVLGEAKDEGGSLRVAKPSAKGGRFIITVKSEEQVLQAAKSGSAALRVAAAALGAAALAVLALMLAGIL
ncbi:MAG: E3 ubiquitin ligase family protein [Spirochaetes bacterium]|nr:E3 ubiquitin ligase family protein [Spirochaetota bacterium]MBU1081171.1 E3 ubiquitin ligase family protein [Spirochaetota bacterium]